MKQRKYLVKRLGENTHIMSEFFKILQDETEYVWKDGKDKNKKKIIHMTTKWTEKKDPKETSKTINGKIDDILISDNKLKERTYA